MLRRFVSLLPTLGVLLAGCSNGEEDRFDFGTATDSGGTAAPTTDPTSATEGTEGTSNESTADGSTSADTIDPGTTSGATMGQTDTDDPGTTTGLPIEPCIGVDVLFVVDNSTGMAEKQLRLTSTATAFVQMLGEGVTAAMGNINVAVITTDEAAFVGPAESSYASGENYMTLDTLAEGELDTALTVGEAGDPNERPMDMLLGATASPLTNAGAHNDGFLREDALLVVVLLTDEEDDIEKVTEWGSAGEPATWIETLAEVKGGLAKDIVVLSIVPTDQGTCAEDPAAPRLIEFTEGFPRGAVYEVCEPDYSTFLLAEIPSINEACDNFTPP